MKETPHENPVPCPNNPVTLHSVDLTLFARLKITLLNVPVSLAILKVLTQLEVVLKIETHANLTLAESEPFVIVLTLSSAFVLIMHEEILTKNAPQLSPEISVNPDHVVEILSAMLPIKKRSDAYVRKDLLGIRMMPMVAWRIQMTLAVQIHVGLERLAMLIITDKLCVHVNKDSLEILRVLRAAIQLICVKEHAELTRFAVLKIIDQVNIKINNIIY
jgi:hypothetical protein